MTTQSIALFKAMGAKMEYLNHRQRVISENIANADTGNYRPRDLTPVDFGGVLKKVIGSSDVRLESTNKQHMSLSGMEQSADEKKQKLVYEVAPAGNAVVMEEQLINSNKTIMDYTLMTSLYQKNIGMIKMAIGRTG
ncbi:MAG: flagellar basal body rod protein FlgB [Alphaproteobacteria bacterium]|nr:flagellar basal body rod protein FlgB [Alphaproteobacteria bacterium]